MGALIVGIVIGFSLGVCGSWVFTIMLIESDRDWVERNGRPPRDGAS